MLPVTSDTVRLFLHVFGASVWIGGQVVLAAIVPVLRPVGAEAVSAAARRFQAVAWPAFGLLLATGVWNLADLGWDQFDGDRGRTLIVKLVMVALSGTCAAVHSLVAGPRVRRAADERAARRARALSGATGAGGLVFALAAVFFGVQL